MWRCHVSFIAGEVSFSFPFYSSIVPTHKFVTSINGRGSSGGLSLMGRYYVSLFILTGFCFITEGSLA